MERIGETKEAEFPGGNKAIRGWLMENVRYPDEALEMGLQGRVFVRFVIDRNGQVTNARTFSSADTILELEALRVVKSMPR